MKPEKYITQYKELAKEETLSVKELFDILIKNKIDPEDYDNVSISSHANGDYYRTLITVSLEKQIPNSNFESEEQAYLAELALQKEQENQRKKEEKAYQDSMNAKRAYREFSRTKRVSAKSAGRNI